MKGQNGVVDIFVEQLILDDWAETGGNMGPVRVMNILSAMDYLPNRSCTIIVRWSADTPFCPPIECSFMDATNNWCRLFFLSFLYIDTRTDVQMTALAFLF